MHFFSDTYFSHNYKINSVRKNSMQKKFSVKIVNFNQIMLGRSSDPDPKRLKKDIEVV